MRFFLLLAMVSVCGCGLLLPKKNLLRKKEPEAATVPQQQREPLCYLTFERRKPTPSNSESECQQEERRMAYEERMRAEEEKEAQIERMLAEQKAQRDAEFQRAEEARLLAEEKDRAERAAREEEANARQAAIQEAEEKRVKELKGRCGAAFRRAPVVGMRYKKWLACWPYPEDIRHTGQSLQGGVAVDVYRILDTAALIYVANGKIVQWTNP